MKRVTVMVFALLMLLSLLVGGDIALAGDEGIVMQVQIGFGDRFRLGNWTPITVDIENGGDDVEGELEVEVIQQNKEAAAVFSTHAVIPRGTRKRFRLYAQINTIQRNFEVKLVQGDSVISSVKVGDVVPVTQDTYMLGLVSDDREALNYWKASLGSNRILYQYEAVHVDAEDFPDRKEIMDNFTIVILNNVDTGKLSQQQIEALRRWVEAGGILIIGTGANGYKTLAGLQGGILPATISGTRQVSEIPALESLGESILRGRVPFDIMDLIIDGAEPVVEHEGKGIVWKIGRGAGYIFISAFDLGLEPYVSWTGNKMFWENILNLHMDAHKVSLLKDIELRKAYGTKEWTVKGERIREALGAGMKAMDLPSFSKLLWVLLAYLVVVGPVNYLVLRRLDRREWTWFTIPITVIAFSAIIYGLGYMAKGGDVITHVISLVDLDESGRADVESHIGVFVPKKGDYRVTVKGDSLLALEGQGVFYYDTPSSGQGDQIWRFLEARVGLGRHPSVTFYNTSVWTMRNLVMDHTLDGFGAIDTKLYFEGNRIKGSITNSLPYPLQDVVVYTSYGYQVLGNLAAGETKQVDVEVFSSSIWWPSRFLYTMLDQAFPSPHNLSVKSGNWDDGVREKYVRRLIVEGLMMNHNYALTVPMEGALHLIGFSTQKIVSGIEVNGQMPQIEYHTNAITMHLDVPYEKDKHVYIPPGVITAVLEREKSQGIAYTEGNMLEYSGNGEAAFYFDMEPYSDLEYSKLEIYVNCEGVVPELYVYHQETGEYVNEGEGLSIDNSRGIISIEGQAVQEYIGSWNRLELKVKVLDAPSTSLDKPRVQKTVQLPTLSIEGRRP